MASKRWGATPDEWQKLIALGLTEDLLPVVSNPKAEISEKSTMSQLGKTPSFYNKQGKVVGIGKWTDKRTTEKEAESWAREPDYGICIQTCHVRAIDIDVDDRDKAQTIKRELEAYMGIKFACRSRSNSGKILLACIVKGEFGKQTIKVDGGIVEMLANGQQFIAAGTHPSGVRYEWDHYEMPVLSNKQYGDAVWFINTGFGIGASTKQGLRKKVSNDEILPDRTYDFLEEEGLVLEYGPEGQAHIECPFSDQHTIESSVSATTYFPAGSRGYQRGHFKCLHAHCAERTDAEFEDALGVRIAEFEDLTLLETGRRRFEAIPLHEFVSVPTPPWRISGILPETGMGMFYGASGSGKTFFAIDLAMSIARGVNWCGRRVNQGNVVYIAAEGAAGSRKRFQAYARHHNVDIEDIPISAIQDAPNLHGSDTKALLKEIKKVEAVRIIIIDTLAQSSPGADENSAKDMGAVINRCKHIQEETGALVILIHHSGKNESAGARGWSGMFAAMDTVIKVSATQKSKKAVIEKQKDGEDGLTFPFKLYPVTLGFDEDNELITSCIVKYTEEEGTTPDLRGFWQELVFRVACDLEINQMPVKDFLEHVIKDVEPPEEGKRDSRKDCALRAIKQVSQHGALLFDGIFVSFPQVRNSSQNDKCEDAA